MFERRGFLVGGLGLMALPSALGAALPIPPGNRIGFDITRKGSKLGTHVLKFASDGNRLTVLVDVVLTYRLLGITLYRYTHHCTEVWQGGEVISLESRTNDNGKPFSLNASRGPAGLTVQSSGTSRYVAPANALPATHWNQRQLSGPWINTQTGQLMHPRVVPGGVEKIAAAKGASLEARRYELTGDAKFSMWYDKIGWAGLSFNKGGALIRYERQA